MYLGYGVWGKYLKSRLKNILINVKYTTMSEERRIIYLCLAHMSEAGLEQKYVKEAFDTNWVVPMGQNVNAFEHALEEFVNEKKI